MRKLTLDKVYKLLGITPTELLTADKTKMHIYVQDLNATAEYDKKKILLSNLIETVADSINKVLIESITFADTPYDIDGDFDENEIMILADATGGNIVVNLPAASTVSGKVVNVKKIDVSVNTVTLDGYNSETIDGQVTQAITSQYDNLTIVSNGTSWHIK